MTVTLEDIAKRVGVTKSTVSVTLRNHPKAQQFSAELRRRIETVASELGYRPNFFASQLTSGKPKVLMLCLSYLRDVYASEVAEAFEQRAAERGYRMLLSVFQDKVNPMEFNRDILGLHGVHAIAVVGASPRKLSDEAVRRLVDDQVQIVMIGREVAGCPEVHHVRCDDHKGARLAAEHLYGQGLRRVWVLEGNGRAQFRLRVDAYRQVAAERGAPPPRLIASEEGTWIENARFATTAALGDGSRPEGILAVGDSIAVGAAQALWHAGLVVGKDVAVVGYDGGLYSECCFPPLTSVRQPTREMGYSGADLLIGALEGETSTGHQVMFEPQLIVRESSVLGGSASA